MKSFKRKSAGFSLIELLLVIGFIAAALVLAFVTYPKVQATNRANTESQHITVLSAGIKNLYSTAKSFHNLSNKVLIDSKIVPDDLTVTGTDINNIWAGKIIVAEDTTPLRYTITYDTVPSSECNKLSTSVATNFLALSVNGQSIFNRTASGGSADIDPSVVSKECNNATNTLVFTGN